MLINEPITHSFSLSQASWTWQQPGSNPVLQGNWRRGRHGVRLSKRAEGCVSKAQQRRTKQQEVGTWGGRMSGRVDSRKDRKRNGN